MSELDTQGRGVLTLAVWPSFAGLARVPDGEPIDNPYYERGQIFWTPQPLGDPIGKALVKVIPGVYSHALFFAGPGPEHQQMRHKQFAHPLVVRETGVVDLNPILPQED